MLERLLPEPMVQLGLWSLGILRTTETFTKANYANPDGRSLDLRIAFHHV